MDNIKKIKAFTLVELIIVISILALLSTIGFVSYQSFMGDSRDSNRLLTLKNIQEGLKMYHLKTNRYPKPEGEVFTGGINGKTLLHTGEFGDKLAGLTQFKSTPIDPSTGKKYAYAIDAKYKKFQIASVLESPLSSQMVSSVYADDLHAKVEGNYEGYLKFTSGSQLWIANIPGLIFNNTGSVDLLSENTFYIVNNSSNLPYLWREFSQNQSASQILSFLTHSSQATLTGVNITGVTNENFEQYFSGVLLESFNVKGLPLNNTGGLVAYVKEIVLGTALPENNNCQPQPSYTNATFSIGQPITKDQAWQSLSAGAACYWTCGAGKVLVGNDCVLENCTGVSPNGTSTLSNATQTSGGSWNYNTTPGICTYTCGTNYTWDGDSCEPSTRSNQVCTGLIANAQWNTASQITQTWSGTLSEWMPTLTGSYHETTSTTECRYKCSDDYIYDSGTSSCISDIRYGLMFDSDASQYLSRTQNNGSLKKQFTISTWIKRAKLGQNQMIAQAYYDGVNFMQFGFDTTDRIMIYSIQGGVDYGYIYAPQYRDVGAWMHIVFTIDTENATGNDRFRLYVNNQRITSVSANYGEPPLNYVTDFLNPGFQHIIGRSIDQSTFFNGYLADVYWIDGQALTPSAFGQTDSTTGQRVAKKYTGTYGTNGFYLDFADGTNLGKDKAGSNNWVLNGGITQANNQVLDHPTNNFATLNPLANTQTLSAGNLKAYGASITATHGSMAIPPSVPVYFEITNISQSHNNLAFGGGVVGTEVSPGVNYQVNVTPRIAGFYASNYQYIMRDNGTNFLAQAANLLANDTIQIAVNGTNMWVGKNNTWYDASGGTTGNPSTGANPTVVLTGSTTYVPYVHLYVNTARMNFGQGGQTGLTYYPNAKGYFKYAPPTGFKSLSTKNLPEPTIKKPNEHFDVVTYTGNGSNQNITGLSFISDLIWIKGRGTATYNNNILLDSLRGINKLLQSNQSVSDVTISNAITAINTNGFSLGAFEDVNTNNNQYVAWNWKAGGPPISNSNGSINTQVLLNPTAGFSIVSSVGNATAGATMGHGLSKVPDFIIRKSRTSSTGHWYVYHKNQGPTKAGILQLTNAFSNSSAWNNTLPTSSVFSVGSAVDENKSGDNYITYLWSEVPGFSKFGSYTGNGSTDGPFLYTGFTPRYIMIKKVNSTSNWAIFDTQRDTENIVDLWLGANVSNAELSSPAAQTFDFVSNGIKLRGIGDDSNVSGATYIYAAFAEFPFKYANAR